MILQIINLVGEPIYRYKLIEMYDDVFMSDKKLLRINKIQRLIEESGLTREDLDL